MTEGIPERFNRSKKGVRDQAPKAEVWLLPAKLNPRIRQYCDQETADGGSWLSRPEIPTAAELMDTDTSSSASSDIVEIAANKPVGAFADKEDYLSTQYELLREDATRPLREAVARVRDKPSSGEDAFDGQIGIYDKVLLTRHHMTDFADVALTSDSYLWHDAIDQRRCGESHFQLGALRQEDHLGAIQASHLRQPGRAHALE